MIIEVGQNYDTWVSQQFVPLFETVGISVTPAARNLLAHAMQAQIEEGIVANDSTLLEWSERIRTLAVKMHLRKYGIGQLNFNRAMHLILALSCA